jgi:hypothetical protein
MSENDGLSVVGVTKSTPDAKDGKIVLHQLRLSDYATAREESLAWYRRDVLKTWSQNADLLPDGKAMLREKFEEMAAKHYHELPPMQIHEYVNDEVAWQQAPEDREINNTHTVEYALWWMAGNPSGMLFVLWLSAKREPSQSHWTQDDVESRYIDETGAINMQALERSAQELGKLSQPSVAGNGQAPTDGGKKKRRREREQRRKRREKRRAGR